MKIKASLSFFALFFIVLAGSLLSNVFAQSHKKLNLENLFMFVPNEGEAVSQKNEIRFYSVTNRYTGELQKEKFFSLPENATFDEMFLVEEVDLKIEQAHKPDPRDEVGGEFFIGEEAKTLFYRPPLRAKKDPKNEHRLAQLSLIAHHSLKLAGDRKSLEYEVYSLGFNKGVSLEPIVKDEKDAIEISYALDIVELQNEDFRLLRLAKWSEHLKERDKSVKKGGSFSADRKLLEKESPALAKSIEEITDALKYTLYNNKERKQSFIDSKVALFKEMLYRISVNVDAYELKTLAGLYRTKDGKFESRHFVPAIDDLVWLFYLQLEQMAVAKKEKNKEQTIALAKKALRTVSEIYLLAGKTKGSAINQTSIQSLISLSLMASSFLIGLSDVLPNNLRVAPFLIGGGFWLHAIFQEIKRIDFREIRRTEGAFSLPSERFSARYLFPGVSFWERKLRSRKIRRNILAESLDVRESFTEKGAPYILDDFTEKKNLQHSNRMLRMIELASGHSLSTIASNEDPSDCAFLFWWSG